MFKRTLYLILVRFVLFQLNESIFVLNFSLGDVMLKFKDRFKNLRDELDLSQTEIGLMLNISQKTVSNYELGNRFPNEDMLNNIADFFDVSVDYLLGRTNIKNIYKNIKP